MAGYTKKLYAAVFETFAVFKDFENPTHFY